MRPIHNGFKPSYRFVFDIFIKIMFRKPIKLQNITVDSLHLYTQMKKHACSMFLYWVLDLPNIKTKRHVKCSTMLTRVKTRIDRCEILFLHCKLHCLSSINVNSCRTLLIIWNFIRNWNSYLVYEWSQWRKNILTPKLNQPVEYQLKFDIMYDEEEHSFNLGKWWLP